MDLDDKNDNTEYNYIIRVKNAADVATILTGFMNYIKTIHGHEIKKKENPDYKGKVKYTDINNEFQIPFDVIFENLETKETKIIDTNTDLKKIKKMDPPKQLKPKKKYDQKKYNEMKKNKYIPKSDRIPGQSYNGKIFYPKSDYFLNLKEQGSIKA